MHSQQRSSHQKCQDEQGAPGKTQTQKGSHREDGSKDRQPGKNSEIVWAAKDWARKNKALTELGDYRLSLRPVLGGVIMEQIILEILLKHWRQGWS